MPPRGDCSEKDHAPATVHSGRDEEALSHVPPSFPVNAAAYEKKKKRKQEHDQVDLPDDVLIEILSRVSYKLLCRFKCVSKQWLAICSDLDSHNSSPHAVSGFFFITDNINELSFHDLTLRGPSLVDPTLAFLGSHEHISVEQCSAGLLLCKCWESRSQDKYSYVVCNPATEKWTVLPPIELRDEVDGHRLGKYYLSYVHRACHFLFFDRVNPSSFVVVVPMINSFQKDCGEVRIYSSETGRWTSMQSQWRARTMMAMGIGEESVFLNGRMHFTSLYHSSIVTVDIEGMLWREIDTPNRLYGSIGQSQEYLHFWRIDDDYNLSVWVLNDYGSANWTIKHTVNILELFGRNHGEVGDSYYVAIHPYCNLLYLTSWGMTMSYNMDNSKMDVICASQDFMAGVPYIPCFAKWSSDRHRKLQ